MTNLRCLFNSAFKCYARSPRVLNSCPNDAIVNPYYAPVTSVVCHFLPPAYSFTLLDFLTNALMTLIGSKTIQAQVSIEFGFINLKYGNSYCDIIDLMTQFGEPIGPYSLSIRQ